MFSRLGTQWRTGPRGLVGLDYGCVRWLFELYAVPDPRAMLEDLQDMEHAYLQELRRTDGNS